MLKIYVIYIFLEIVINIIIFFSHFCFFNKMHWIDKNCVMIICIFQNFQRFFFHKSLITTYFEFIISKIIHKNFFCKTKIQTKISFVFAIVNRSIVARLNVNFFAFKTICWTYHIETIISRNTQCQIVFWKNHEFSSSTFDMS